MIFFISFWSSWYFVNIVLYFISDVRADGNVVTNVVHSMLTMQEQQKYLNSQDGTARLDSFSHCLISKCPSEVNDVNPS